MTKFKMGMVGGSNGFIGEVHRKAALLTGDTELVAGAFSSDPAKAAPNAAVFHIAPERSYETWLAMAEAEAAREDRIDFVSVVTPNHLHLPVIRAFARAGIPIFCEKPIARTLNEAEEIAAIVEGSGVPFGLAHVYSGYPMVREARAQVESGVIGDILHVSVNYTHGNMLDVVYGERQGNWRTRPDISGPSNVIADIGTHAVHLAKFVIGEWPERVLADLVSGHGQELENTASILSHYPSGARGLFHVSQLCAGDKNNFTFKITGSDGTLEWHQNAPEVLWLRPKSSSAMRLLRGDATLLSDEARNSFLPPGHPEGFIEAFASLYTSFKTHIFERGQEKLPSVGDGVAGMRFVSAALESHESQSWTNIS